MQMLAKDTGRRSLLGCALFAVSVAGWAADNDATFRGSASPDMDTRQSTLIAELGTFGVHDYSPAAAGAAAAEGSGKGYRWDGPPAATPDWWGIERDTLYFVGYQFAAIGVLYIAPEDVSGWSDEDKDDYSFEKWLDNVGNPVWDEDKWWINYILHPYWGGAYYIRAQERGFTPVQSFFYSALLSTMYEFGAEALFEAPSYQDIIVTPLVGALVGQFLFAPIRESIRAAPGEPGWAGKAVLLLTDPMGVVNVGTDRLLGVEADLSLQLAPMSMPDERWAERADASDWPSGKAPVAEGVPGWGLQLRARW